MIQAGGETLRSEIHTLINSIWIKKELPYQWKKSFTVPIYEMGEKLTVVIIGEYHCYQFHTKFYPISFSQGQVHTHSLTHSWS
jgi:hypothetical protein